MATLTHPAFTSFDAVAPVVAAERISSVDVLRGFSLLGILLMNVVTFGLPETAYADPTVAGGSTGLNLLAWTISYVLFEGKMRAIFSMLFGAGVIIFTARAESRGAGLELADTYYRRTLWLMLFGLIHAYFIWDGDILFHYGACALILFPLRKLSPRTLIITGMLLMAVLIPKRMIDDFQFEKMRKESISADTAARNGQIVTAEQKAAQEKWAERLKELKPDKQTIEKQITRRTVYATWFVYRAGKVPQQQALWFYQRGFFDICGMMLLGMGLMKAGVFSALRSVRFYTLLALAGYGVGVTVNAITAQRLIANQFDSVSHHTTYDLGRMSVALAHIAVIMLISKARLFKFITKPLSAVGQMALTCYLSTSVMCMIFFERFGMFGRLQRYQLYYVVVTVWMILLVGASLWLRHFRFGPMEWVWRSLTYWKKQPMRLETTPAAESTRISTGL